MAESFPAFVPLKIDFDRASVCEEILSNLELLKPRSVVYSEAKSEFYSSGPLEKALDAEKLAQTAHYRHGENGERIWASGKYSTFVVGNLTWVPGIEDSKDNISFDEGGKRLLYIHRHTHAWQWREDVAADKLRGVLDGIGFDYLQMVRVIAMFPPAVGVIHRDSGPKGSENYYNQGHVSLTLNLADGGGRLFFDKQGQVFECRGSAWHFNDSYPHGVSEISSPRIQLRIWGKMPISRYRDLMDLSQKID